MKLLLFLYSIVFLGSSLKISVSENEILQKQCGQYKLKSNNIDPLNYPSFVAVYFKPYFMNRGVLTPIPYPLPGIIISPQHIVIRSVLDKNPNGSISFFNLEMMSMKFKCDGKNMILNETYNSRFDYDFVLEDKYNAGRKFNEVFSEIKIINGCEDVYNEKLMILTLKKPILFSDKIGAACLSNSTENWLQTKNYTVYGPNGSGILSRIEYYPVPCETKKPLVCARASEKEQGICAKNMGGTAIGLINQRQTFTGIFVRGLIDCEFFFENIPYSEFLNIGAYTKEICEATGVCVN